MRWRSLLRSRFAPARPPLQMSLGALGDERATAPIDAHRSAHGDTAVRLAEAQHLLPLVDLDACLLRLGQEEVVEVTPRDQEGIGRRKVRLHLATAVADTRASQRLGLQCGREQEIQGSEGPGREGSAAGLLPREDLLLQQQCAQAEASGGPARRGARGPPSHDDQVVCHAPVVSKPVCGPATAAPERLDGVGDGAPPCPAGKVLRPLRSSTQPQAAGSIGERVNDAGARPPDTPASKSGWGLRGAGSQTPRWSRADG